jgi:hypothetical protein
LRERSRHRHVKRRGRFAAGFLGVDLAEQRVITIGIVDANIVLQVIAIILQLAQFRRRIVGLPLGQSLKEQIPTLLVFLPKIRIGQRIAQRALAVHEHLVHGAK